MTKENPIIHPEEFEDSNRIELEETTEIPSIDSKGGSIINDESRTERERMFGAHIEADGGLYLDASTMKRKNEELLKKRNNS